MCLCIVAVILHYPLLQDISHKTFYANHDDVRFFLMVIAWSYQALSNDVGSWFHAPLFFPYPYALTYSETLIGETLLGLGPYFLTGNIILTYNCILLFSVALSGIATFLLVRALVQDQKAAFLCGLAVLSPPEHFSELAHIQSLQLQWVPFSLYFLVGYIRQGRAGSLVGLVISLAMLAYSNLYFSVFFFISMLGFGPLLIIIDRSWCDQRRFFGLILSIIALGLILTPLIYSHIEAANQIDYEKELTEIESLSADLIDYFCSTSWLYFEWSGHNMITEGHFPGVMIAIFGVVGLITLLRGGWRKDKLVFAFYVGLIGSGLITFLLSLGPVITWAGKPLGNLPFHIFYTYIPGLSAIRALSRFGHFTYIFVVVLAGLGFSALFSVSMFKKRSMVWKIAITAFLAFIIMIETFSPIHLATYEAPPEPNPELMHFLSEAVEDSGVLHLPVYEFMPQNSIYEWWSIFHWQPIIFAHSSNYPRAIVDLAEQMKYFPSHQSIAALQASFPVKYVVLHQGLMHQPLFERMQRMIGEFPALSHIHSFDQDHVYGLSRIGRGTELLRLIPVQQLGPDGVQASLRLIAPLESAHYCMKVAVPHRVLLSSSLDDQNNYSLDFKVAQQDLVMLYEKREPLSLKFTLETSFTMPEKGLDRLSEKELEQLPFRIDVVSQPMRQDGFREALISINGHTLRTEQRGLLLAVISPETGQIVRYQVFDTHADRSASTRMVEFLDKLEPGGMVAGAVCDEASALLTAEASQCLRQLGLLIALEDYYRYGLAFIAWPRQDGWNAKSAHGSERVTISLGPPIQHFQFELTAFTTDPS